MMLDSRLAALSEVRECNATLVFEKDIANNVFLNIMYVSRVCFVCNSCARVRKRSADTEYAQKNLVALFRSKNSAKSRNTAKSPTNTSQFHQVWLGEASRL
jgi:hypothetical protein